MKVIGLTGGIATGKSFVAATLEKMGAVIVDADLLAREVVQPGAPAFNEIVATFGEEIVGSDGTLDRKTLGRIVFADEAARKKLEQITHPAIIKLGEERITRERDQGKALVVYVVPLLFEAGLSSSMDEVWVVYCDEETQIRRLRERERIGRDEALRKIMAQMPLKEKLEMADVVIDNSGTLEETERKVGELWREREPGAKG